MRAQGRIQAFVRSIAGPTDVSRTSHVSNAFRSLLFGRGRRRRFGVPPAVRQARKLFTTYPMVSNSLTYGCFFVGAELCQQLARERFPSSSSSSHQLTQKSSLDLSALKRYAFWGTVVVPPIYYKWYKWLDAAYRTCSKSPLNKKVLFKKLFLDQFVLTPVTLAMFFVGMAAMEGQDSLMAECRVKFVPTFVADCLFWLPIQAFNFRFVPQDMRVAFLGVTTFVWVNVLCFIKSLPEGSFVKEGPCEKDPGCVVGGGNDAGSAVDD